MKINTKIKRKKKYFEIAQDDLMTSKWTYDYIDIYFSTVVQSKILYTREISDKQIIYSRNAPITEFVQEHSRDNTVFIMIKLLQCLACSLHYLKQLLSYFFMWTHSYCCDNLTPFEGQTIVASQFTSKSCVKTIGFLRGPIFCCILAGHRRLKTYRGGVFEL